MLSMAKADDWILAPGKGSISPDPAFSKGLDSPDLSIDSGPWTAFEAINNLEAIPTAGKTYVSPDKRFSVQTGVADRELQLVIKDRSTGSINHLTNSLCPIFCVQWSPDSKTLLAVEHASETSLIELVHWDGHGWHPFEIDAPEEGDNDKFHVTKWEFTGDHLEATYLVDNRTDKGESVNFYRCTFRIDPRDGKTSNVAKMKITRKEFLSLRNASN